MRMRRMTTRISRRNVLGSLAAASVVGIVPATARSGRFDLEEFVSDLRAANEEADAQLAVENVLTREFAEPGNILRALGEPTTVGLTPIYRASNLTVLNIVWPPWMMLPAHNHLMWATIGIYTGREDNVIWKRQAGGVVEAFGAASLSEGEVFSLPHDAIHSVTNPIPRLTAAIHVYGGDFFEAERSEWDPDTLTEHPQDFEAVQRLFRDTNRRFQATQE